MAQSVGIILLEMFRSTQQLIGKFGMDLGATQILHQVLIVLAQVVY
jgi:hypothetical protein